MSTGGGAKTYVENSGLNSVQRVFTRGYSVNFGHVLLYFFMYKLRYPTQLKTYILELLYTKPCKD